MFGEILISDLKFNLTTYFPVVEINYPVDQVSAILTFLTFMIGKFESSKFQNCLSKTKFLGSYFEITNSKSESQQSALQMNETEQK